LNPVTTITISAVGPPGRRVFYLQASQGAKVVTLIIEKQHAVLLAASLDDFLAELNARFPRPSSPVVSLDANLRQPADPAFRVAQMALGYDESADMVVLIAYQVVEEEGGDEGADAARFWATREQMQSLRDRALLEVEGGRPVCGLCSELIDAQGHLCVRRNGHGNHRKFGD